MAAPRQPSRDAILDPVQVEGVLDSLSLSENRRATFLTSLQRLPAVTAGDVLDLLRDPALSLWRSRATVRLLALEDQRQPARQPAVPVLPQPPHTISISQQQAQPQQAAAPHPAAAEAVPTQRRPLHPLSVAVPQSPPQEAFHEHFSQWMATHTPLPTVNLLAPAVLTAAQGLQPAQQQPSAEPQLLRPVGPMTPPAAKRPRREEEQQPQEAQSAMQTGRQAALSVQVAAAPTAPSSLLTSAMEQQQRLGPEPASPEPSSPPFSAFFPTATVHAQTSAILRSLEDCRVYSTDDVLDYLASKPEIRGANIMGHILSADTPATREFVAELRSLRPELGLLRVNSARPLPRGFAKWVLEHNKETVDGPPDASGVRTTVYGIQSPRFADPSGTRLLRRRPPLTEPYDRRLMTRRNDRGLRSARSSPPSTPPASSSQTSEQKQEREEHKGRASARSQLARDFHYQRSGYDFAAFHYLGGIQHGTSVAMRAAGGLDWMGATLPAGIMQAFLTRLVQRVRVGSDSAYFRYLKEAVKLLFYQQQKAERGKAEKTERTQDEKYADEVWQECQAQFNKYQDDVISRIRYGFLIPEEAYRYSRFDADLPEAAKENGAHRADQQEPPLESWLLRNRCGTDYGDQGFTNGQYSSALWCRWQPCMWAVAFIWRGECISCLQQIADWMSRFWGRGDGQRWRIRDTHELASVRTDALDSLSFIVDHPWLFSIDEIIESLLQAVPLHNNPQWCGHPRTRQPLAGPRFVFLPDQLLSAVNSEEACDNLVRHAMEQMRANEDLKQEQRIKQWNVEQAAKASRRR